MLKDLLEFSTIKKENRFRNPEHTTIADIAGSMHSLQQYYK